MAGLKHPSQYSPPPERLEVTIDPSVPKGQPLLTNKGFFCHKDDAEWCKQTAIEYFQDKYNKEALQLLWELPINKRH